MIFISWKRVSSNLQVLISAACHLTLEKAQYLLIYLLDNLSFARKCPVQCHTHTQNSLTGVEPVEVLRSQVIQNSRVREHRIIFNIFFKNHFSLCVCEHMHACARVCVQRSEDNLCEISSSTMQVPGIKLRYRPKHVHTHT